MQIFLCNGKHPAGTAGRIIKRFRHIVPGENIIVIIEQDVDHELDNLTGSIVLPCILIVRLGESADDFFKDISHFKIGDNIRMQICLR